MSIYIDKETQFLWNRLCELYTQEERDIIYSDLEFLIEQTALAKEVSLDENDAEHKELNSRIAGRYIQAVYGVAVYYLQKFPDSKEIPVISFSYEELFREESKEKPAEPEKEQPG